MSGMPANNPSPPAMDDVMKVKFSSEDIRILQECNKESFYNRCLPLSGLFGFATYSAIKSGYLTTGTRFGAFPKISFAVAMGFVLGKISYRNICAERLMQSPNSEVGEVLRKRLNRPLLNNYEKRANDLPFVSSSTQENTLQTNSSLDLDTDNRPSFAPAENSIYPSSGEPIDQTKEDSLPISSTLTYDDIRKQNRESFSQRRVQPYKIEQLPKATNADVQRETKNKYGDVID